MGIVYAEEKTKEGEPPQKKQEITKKKMLRLFIIVIVVIISIIISINCYNSIQVKSKITRECVSICKSFGLEDAKINITGKSTEYGWYDVEIDVSNMSKLSTQEMIDFDKKFHSVDDVYINSYSSNGDNYRILPSTLTIYKNGDKIYDNYKNSESYNSVDSNDNKSTNSADIKVTDDEELGACWALAEEVITSKLKSPSSAKFPFSYISDGVNITNSGDTYTVKAWVESENSFGASIKSDFIVTMTKSGSTFTATSFVIS